MKVVRHHRTRGFTLVEAVITIAIMALVMGVVVVGFTAASASLRSTAGQLSGTLRATFDRASLTGQIHRVVFSMGKEGAEPDDNEQSSVGIIKVETTEEVLAFDEENNPLVRGAKSAGGGATSLASSLGMGGGFSFGDVDLEDEFGEEGPPSALKALAGLNERAEEESKASFVATEHEIKLDRGISVRDVWVRGMEDPATEGDIYLYFFPQGYTQDAVIHLQDDDEAIFTVKLHALTGKTEVRAGFEELEAK